MRDVIINQQHQFRIQDAARKLGEMNVAVL